MAGAGASSAPSPGGADLTSTAAQIRDKLRDLLRERERNEEALRAAEEAEKERDLQVGGDVIWWGRRRRGGFLTDGL